MEFGWVGFQQNDDRKTLPSSVLELPCHSQLASELLWRSSEPCRDRDLLLKGVLPEERRISFLTKNALVAWISLPLACPGPSARCGNYFAIPGAHGEKPAGHVWSGSACPAAAAVQCGAGWRGALAAPPLAAHVWAPCLPGAGAHGAEVSVFSSPHLKEPQLVMAAPSVFRVRSSFLNRLVFRYLWAKSK